MWQIPHKERKLLTKGFIELCMFPLVGEGGGGDWGSPSTNQKNWLADFFIDGNDHHDDENNAY